MYPINAKLDFHVVMGPEGHKKQLLKLDNSSLYYFHTIFYDEGIKNVILYLLAEAPLNPPPPKLAPFYRVIL